MARSRRPDDPRVTPQRLRTFRRRSSRAASRDVVIEGRIRGVAGQLLAKDIPQISAETSIWNQLSRAKGGLTYHLSEMSYGEADVRTAVVNDARSIAEVHVESWETTYKGIFPEALLESMSTDNRERSWKETLAVPRLVTLVGCAAGDKSWGSYVVGPRERVS